MKSFKRQIYKFGLIEDDDKNPPTVDDNNEEYTTGIFTFNTSHFTNNFQDPDGDSHKLTRIRTLPLVGTLSYAGNSVDVGHTFNLSNVGNLTYELPDNYMITSEGYCEFEKPISTIISEQETEGFNLTYMGSGRLEFERTTSSSLPNDTDIYAFFDATSMKMEDAEAAHSALLEWYDEFNQDNELFTGNLYILPIVKEDWLDFPVILYRGSSNRVRNNSDRPNDDFMALSILPPNFDLTSNEENPNWTPPTNLVTLAFIDEVSDGGEAYHKNRNGYGFDGQPSAQYFTDYKNFRDIYSSFNFFKGILYPIPDIEFGNFNNIGNAMVLQGFGAIEGGATYTLQEIEDLGVTFARERRFHWHLDPTHSYYSGTHLNIANPYSSAAQTPVPFSNYYLEGLKNFGWAGVYDKDQPASSVFSSDTFNSDLNKYLQGETIENTETKVILGECIEADNICFDFQTSDDSTFTLFSNIATFCFTGTGSPDQVQSQNAPVVDSMNRDYSKGIYDMVVEDFTKNFTDIDGDTYKDVRLLSKFTSSKGIPVGGITYEGIGVAFPYIVDLSNIDYLKYNIPDTYFLNNNRLIQFNGSLEIDINDLETQGYSLLKNEGNKLTYNKLNIVDPLNPTVETQIIEGKDIGDGRICLPFKTSDDSNYNLYSNTAQLCLDMESDNSTSTVEGGSTNLTNLTYTFSIGNFTNNFNNTDGNIPKTVKIIDMDTSIGVLTFKDVEVELPFSFAVNDSNQLKFELDNKFMVSDGIIYEFDSNISEIVTTHRDEGYSLESNDMGVLVFTDPDGNMNEIKYEGIVLETTELCVIFATSNNGFIETFSNQADFCLIPQGDINVPTLDNQPPTMGDVTIYVETEVTTEITMDTIKNQSQPPYSDKENDLIDAIRIDKINPDNTGRFYFNGSLIIIGQIITREQIESGLFVHKGEDINDVKIDSFSFSIRDEVNRKWVK